MDSLKVHCARIILILYDIILIYQLQVTVMVEWVLTRQKEALCSPLSQHLPFALSWKTKPKATDEWALWTGLYYLVGQHTDNFKNDHHWFLSFSKKTNPHVLARTEDVGVNYKKMQLSGKH